jgi:hypothetical protein
VTAEELADGVVDFSFQAETVGDDELRSGSAL